jgi:intracellular septation protein A
MWRELGLADSELRALPGRFVFGVLVPQFLFFLGLRQGGLAVALVLAAGWSLALQLYEFRRRHRWDPFLLYGLTFTFVQGAASLYTRSPAVYAGGGIVENLLGGALLLGSILVCRPLLVEVLGSVIGGQAALTLPVQGALWRLTILWAFLFLGRSVVLYAALTHTTIGQFLVINTLAGWPLNGVGIVLSLLYVQAQLRRRPSVRDAASCVRSPTIRTRP